MAVIPGGGSVIDTEVRVYHNAAAPVASVNDVQTLTGTATGGTFAAKLTYNGAVYTTAPLAFNASAATVQAAIIAALPSTLGANPVACSGGALGSAGVVVTFSNGLGNAPRTLITIDNTLATGGTVTVAHTTTGVTATFSGITPTGALLVDTATPNLYINTGTQAIPVWKSYTHA